jgi:hypothetical protein
MKRVAAHLVYCNPQQIIPHGVIEVDEQGIIRAIFSLDTLPQESHSTIFYNGILIPSLINKEQLASYQQKEVIPLLDVLYASKMIGLKVGEKAQIYLLENLDLVGKRFLEETTLTFLEF